MTAPNVLALQIEEAAKRLAEAGYEYEVETLLPPRDSEAAFADSSVRKYVVRQRELSANKIVLTLVYRVGKEVHNDGFEN